MSSTLIIGCIIAFTCIFHSTRLMQNARGDLTDEELNQVDAETQSGVRALVMPLIPLLMAYFLQDQIPVNPLFLLFLAFLVSIIIVGMQSMNNIKRYKAIGVSDRFISSNNRANLIRWVGLIIFMITYVLTKMGVAN